MTSAPPAIETARSPASACAAASASANPSTKVNPVAASGASCVRCVTTKSRPPNGLVPPQAPAASYMPRPTDAGPELRDQAVDELPVGARHAPLVSCSPAYVHGPPITQ